jgi:hypothetical protein
MTQHALILEWIKEYGFIIPAKMSGNVYYGIMFGSESSKRCRELRKQGKLISTKNGKFEEFRLKPEPVKTIVPDNQIALL